MVGLGGVHATPTPTVILGQKKTTDDKQINIFGGGRGEVKDQRRIMG